MSRPVSVTLRGDVAAEVRRRSEATGRTMTRVVGAAVLGNSDEAGARWPDVFVRVRGRLARDDELALLGRLAELDEMMDLAMAEIRRAGSIAATTPQTRIERPAAKSFRACLAEQRHVMAALNLASNARTRSSRAVDLPHGEGSGSAMLRVLEGSK